ncbi:MAG: hypothetical protein ACOY4Q_10165 [Bacillota bacterium]
MGKIIELSGFIYIDETLKPNQFGVVRYTISCCTADATVTGFLCETSKPVQYTKGIRVKI